MENYRSTVRPACLSIETLKPQAHTGEQLHLDLDPLDNETAHLDKHRFT